jgi:hypothetical protein
MKLSIDNIYLRNIWDKAGIESRRYSRRLVGNYTGDIIGSP